MKKLIILSACLVGTFLSLSAYSMIGGDRLELPGFQVLVKEGGRWIEKGTLPFRMHYEEKGIRLEPVLPEADGQYKIRISHLPVGMANLDNLSLAVGGEVLTPARIVDVATGEDLGGKLSKKDLDVINAQGRTIEVHFRAPASSADVVLNVTGREEDPDHIPGGPCAYPAPDRPAPDGSAIYHYSLGSQSGALHVDGQLAANDRLGQPLMKSWTEPISGHPNGFTYSYVKDDGHYLYTAIDFTSDNTYDGLQDFSAVLIQTPQGWKRYQVSVDQQKWGKPGFIYTDKVAYQHKVYEFKIPLADLGVKKGAQLAMRFEAYGTAACPLSTVVSVTKGGNNPVAANLIIDDSVAEVPMLQAHFAVSGAGAIYADTIAITGDGTGNETSDIEAVDLYKEVAGPGAGVLDGSDVFLGSGTFSVDNGTAVVDLPTDSFNMDLPPGGTLLVVYRVKPSTPSGSTFRAHISSNSDVTTQSPCNSTVSYTGAPIDGDLMTMTYGQTAAALGAHNPGEAQGGPGQSNIPMLQFSLAASAAEDQGLKTVRVTGGGSGSDVGDVSGVHLWADNDGDGIVSVGDVELGTAQTFDADNGTATFALSPAAPLGAGVTKNYLVTYNFAAATAALPSWMGHFKDRFVAGLHLRPQLFFPWAYPLALTGCGGGGGGNGTIVTLSDAPAGTRFTDADGNAITTAADGSTVQLRTTEGALILEFTMGAASVSLSGATAGRDTDETLVDLAGTGAALIVDGTKSAVSGLPDTITVFVPCDANDNEVRICPGATELTDALAACDGAIFLGAPASGFTFANTDRTGTDDCQITGAPSAFADFLAMGVSVTTFQASLAASSDVVLTGVSSTRTINPTGLPLSGGEKTVVGP